ncbi:hypothetical protein BST97_12665 [Nonlabens spongiae]|uniref:Lipocalin-like domain-containing protein n=1 Tax=Nonlabens spongiae TaxID=331648 RepID=A0A1W6MMN6_9FLAO|nr:hypothetical protein [Nonlabens spongiae]ARN78776.1 hypothetical protein BST97_12665 [Nonlabens spongiae]
MKNFKIALIALFAVVISSCSDDDGPGFEFNQENIAGTYTLTFFESNETIVETLQATGNQVTTTVDIEGDTFSGTRFNLNDNGTYSISGNIRITETSQTGSDPVEVEDPVIIPIDDSGTYSINTTARTLTLTSTGEGGLVYDVDRFSESGFRIRSQEVETDTDFESTTVTEIRLERVN